MHMIGWNIDIKMCFDFCIYVHILYISTLCVYVTLVYVIFVDSQILSGFKVFCQT